MKGFDVIAMPSIWEACGLVGMEALTAGVPIIGTSCIGLREVLKDTPAIVIPPGDALSLAVALEHQIDHPKIDPFKEFMPIAYNRFNIDHTARRLHSLYKELM